MNAPRTRVQRRPVHGVLLLDKPLGMSSNQALQKAKWLLRAEKAGHTGTLDPLASGVLPLCFGAATKFSQIHLDADKTYETTIALGLKTATGDAEGPVIQTRPVQCSVGQVVEALDHFTGPVQQVPPMHSALKKDGKALYEYARQGVSVTREAREVQIHALELVSVDLNAQPPVLSLRVRCSKGTYIRTLGEDIAEHLGCGGHLTHLRRIATGPFGIEQCITLQQLEDMPESQRTQALLPVEVLLSEHISIELAPTEAGRFLSGLRRKVSSADHPSVRVYGQQPHALLGTAHIKAGELIPTRLLSPLDIEQVLNQSAAPAA
jgi:tRNA pseudouridine55 synthase